MSSRLVYEWHIFNAMSTSSANSIDYTCIPSENNFLNWRNYKGGFELTIPPNRNKSGTPSSSKGAVGSLGFRQAASRAANCVYDRWKQDPSREYKAYCCYGDSRRLGLVRVSSLSQAPWVAVQDTGLMNLPGFERTPIVGASDGSTALNLIYHLLYSSSEELEFFITPATSVLPTQFADDMVLGPFLGAGGFGVVYSDLHNQGRYVIKSSDEYDISDRLANEKRILDYLRDIEGVPRLIACFEEVTAKSEKVIRAMKLAPFGVPVRTAISKLNSRMEKRAFIRRICIDVVSILQNVHAKNIFHKDVRCPNILVIPPEDVRVLIATDKEGISTSEHISKIFKSSYSIILNDWGEAVVAKDNEEKKGLAIEDLQSLVHEICRADHHASAVPRCKNKSARHHIHNPLPSISVQEYQNLFAIAGTGRYDRLKAEFRRLSQ